MKTAIDLRIEWLRLMCLSEDEIQENLIFDPPQSVEVEQEELDAVRKLQAMEPLRWGEEGNLI